LLASQKKNSVPTTTNATIVWPGLRLILCPNSREFLIALTGGFECTSALMGDPLMAQFDLSTRQEVLATYWGASFGWVK